MTKHDSWDGIFYPISLHSVLEHLPSDTRSIKELLHCMSNCTKNKSIESNKANHILDLKGIGEAVWSFIFAIYESGWNSLITDKDN